MKLVDVMAKMLCCDQEVTTIPALIALDDATLLTIAGGQGLGGYAGSDFYGGPNGFGGWGTVATPEGVIVWHAVSGPNGFNIWLGRGYTGLA